MTTPITVVFDPPLPSDTEEVFDEKAFDSLAKMNTWSSQANAIAEEINDAATDPAVQAVGADLAGANTVGAVAAIDAEVAAVAAVDTEVVVVAGVAANVSTVAGIAANVTTVAGVAANVTTVADNIAAVNTAAANITAIIAAPGAASTASSAAGAAVGAKEAAEAAAIAAAESAESIAGGPVTSVNGQTGVVVLDAEDVGAEPAITAGTSAQYRRGDKTWRDFATDVRAAVLTGLSTASAVAVAAADSVLVAIGKLQAQLDLKGYKNIPQNSQSAAYTLVLTDAGKHILHPSADTTARTFTIPANASVAFEIGTAITFVNQASAGVVTIAITSDTMRLAGAGTTGSRTLAANGVATAIKVTATEWIISGTGLT